MKSFVFGLVFLIAQIQMQAQSNVLSPDAFESGMKTQKVQLLDVRTMGEFNTAHLDNALQADWLNSAEFQERIKHLDSSLPVYVYCQAGIRSHNAAVYLQNQKHFKVYELQGGISNWMAAGKSVIQLKKVVQMGIDSFNLLLPKRGLCLVDFNAKWCAPCVKMKPGIDSLSKHYQSIAKVVQIDGAEQTDLCKSYQVNGFPTLILYKNGQEVWRQQGFMTFDDLLAKLQSFQ